MYNLFFKLKKKFHLNKRGIAKEKKNFNRDHFFSILKTGESFDRSIVCSHLPLRASIKYLVKMRNLYCCNRKLSTHVLVMVPVIYLCKKTVSRCKSVAVLQN